jgi:hypothetical protein
MITIDSMKPIAESPPPNPAARGDNDPRRSQPTLARTLLRQRVADRRYGGSGVSSRHA